jgi:hypothetical protein
MRYLIREKLLCFGDDFWIENEAGRRIYMRSHLKCHEIANLITTQAWELSMEATKALRRMRRRPSIIAACFSQTELWP